MKLYKLTDENYETHNKTKWGPNVTHEANSEGNYLCTDQVIHAYEDAILAILMNPTHSDFYCPVLWEAEGDIVASDGTKCGVKRLTTVKIVGIPEITKTQKIAFGILCALEVYKEPKFLEWANDWLTNKNRTADAAHTSADDAYAATRDANNASAYNAYAANAASCAASYADDDVAYTVACAATSAAKAAYYSALAAFTTYTTATTTTTIDFIKLARKAMEY